MQQPLLTLSVENNNLPVVFPFDNNKDINNDKDNNNHGAASSRIFSNVNSFPMEVIRLSNLNELEITDSPINFLPSQLSELTTLNKLSLRKCKFRLLPQVIQELSSLKHLDLSENRLSQLPLIMLSSLKSLKSLNVSNNRITYLSSGDEACPPNLEELYVSHNSRLKLFPTAVCGMHSLKILDLSGCNLTALDENIADMQSLTILILQDNKISSLPSNLPTNLETLSLSNNRIQKISSRFCDAQSPLLALKHLDLSHNEIESVPESMGDCLMGLITLNLSHNKIFSISFKIGRYPNLVHLNLRKNALINLHPSISECSKLQILDVGENFLTSLPMGLERLHLRQLEADNNDLSCGGIPACLGFISTLRKINLSDNKLRHIPFPLGALTRLTQLYLSENYIMYLPELIHKLTALQILDVKSNQISYLPDGLFSAPQLKMIDLRRNRLEQLQDRFSQMEPLERLHLDSNLLTMIPPSISRMPNLSHLTLDNNDIHHIPAELAAKIATGNLFVSNKLDTPSQITPNLYLSSMFAAENKNLLESLGITHILIVAQGMTPRHPANFKYRQIDMKDEPNERLVDQVNSSCIQFLNSGKCLVHCARGISRSATVVIAYLMIHEGLSLKESFDKVASARPFIRPNQGFMQQLQELEQKLRNTS